MGSSWSIRDDVSIDVTHEVQVRNLLEEHIGDRKVLIKPPYL